MKKKSTYQLTGYAMLALILLTIIAMIIECERGHELVSETIKIETIN